MTLVTFHVTGFGEFRGVSKNPSADIVERLPSALALSREKADFSLIRLASCDILEVSGKSVKKHLEQIEGSFPASPPCVALHLGVDTNATSFRLEQMAYNDATFRCADEQGWQPFNQPIEDNHVAPRQTTLPLGRIHKDLTSRGFRVEVSHDPGRFVCNYIYYLSLKMTENKLGMYSLFLHVPPETFCSVHDQTTFVLELLDAIAKEARACDERTIKVVPKSSRTGDDRQNQDR